MDAPDKPHPKSDRRAAVVKWLVYAASLVIVAVAAKNGIQLPAPALPVADPPRCCPCPPAPPPQPCPPDKPPAPPVPPQSKPDAPAALVRIQFGSAGCTATVIGPRREDGRWWVLTAAHCVRASGQHGTMRLKDGRTTGVIVAAVDTKADACWLVTESNSEVYPYALLAQRSPAVGSKIWHAGYGVHVPGNREEGYVEAGPDQNGQVRFRLSVSSGDSGGGICLNENDEVVSCVCCTTAKNQVAQVWGASPEAIHRAKPTVMALDDWTPVELPVRPPVDDVPDVMPAKR